MLPAPRKPSSTHKPLCQLLALALLASLAFLPHSEAGSPEPEQILVIGLGANKQPISSPVNAARYRKTLTTTFSAVHDSILPSLTLNESRERQQNRWHLRSVGVGVGLSGTMGLGPIFSVTAETHLRLIFSNHLSPIYPD